MFFYKLNHYDYDTETTIIYYNENEYSQSEFEDIVFKVYGEVCQDVLDRVKQSPCYYNLFLTVDEVMITDEFESRLQEYGFYSVEGNLTGEMYFIDVNDDYNDRVWNVLSGLVFDKSCRVNDCSRLDDGNGCGEFIKEDCLIIFLYDYEDLCL